MATHFISVLGTSFYEPVSYSDEKGFASQETDFVQLALLEKYQDELEKDENAKVTILVTEQSEKLNYMDRIYSDRDVENSRRWQSDIKSTVVLGETKSGLYKKICEQFPKLASKVECKIISNGDSESEIWNNFDIIYKCLRNDDQIIFDITHSFRSIPMIAIAIVNYAKTMKNCQLFSLLYGAFLDDESGNKIGKIVDLTVYNEILEWTSAAESFMQTGSAKIIKKVYNQKKATKMKSGQCTSEQKDDLKQIGQMVQSAECLSSAIQTCRGVDAANIERESNFKNTFSIKAAASDFLDYCNESERIQNNNEFKALYHLFKKVEEQYGEFNKEKNYEIGLEVVKYCIEKNMIQQAYTALEESVKTFMCEYFGIDQLEQRTRDTICGGCIVVLSDASKNGVDIDDIDNRKKIFIEAYDNDFAGWKKGKKPLAEDEKKLCERIIEIIPSALVIEAMNIKNDRNDINHFGMKKSALNASTFSNNIKKYYDKVIIIFEDMQNK